MPGAAAMILRMDRRSFTISALAVLAARSFGQQPGKADSRLSAIYSTVLRQRCECCADPKELWLIDDRTYAPALPDLRRRDLTRGEEASLYSDGQDHPYIQPPQDRVADLSAAIESIRIQSAEPLPIPRSLSIPRRYRLITAEEHRQYEVYTHPTYRPAGQPSPPAMPSRYRSLFSHAYGTFSLSPIGFNDGQTLAVFAYRNVGGCSDESWHALERSGRGWRELKWRSMGFAQCD